MSKPGKRPLGGKVLDPEWRKRRATIASRAAHSLDNYVARIVRDAPDLKPEHIEQLRAALPPVPAKPQAGVDDAA